MTKQQRYKWALSSTSISPIDFPFVLTQKNEQFHNNRLCYSVFCSPHALISLHFPLQAFIAKGGNNDIKAIVFLCELQTGVIGYQRWGLVFPLGNFIFMGHSPPESGVIQGEGEKSESWELRRRQDIEWIILPSWSSQHNFFYHNIITL